MGSKNECVNEPPGLFSIMLTQYRHMSSDAPIIRNLIEIWPIVVLLNRTVPQMHW